jgi:hypothetical protein
VARRIRLEGGDVAVVNHAIEGRSGHGLLGTEARPALELGVIETLRPRFSSTAATKRSGCSTCWPRTGAAIRRSRARYREPAAAGSPTKRPSSATSYDAAAGYSLGAWPHHDRRSRSQFIALTARTPPSIAPDQDRLPGRRRSTIPRPQLRVGSPCSSLRVAVTASAARPLTDSAHTLYAPRC